MLPISPPDPTVTHRESCEIISVEDNGDQTAENPNSLDFFVW